MSQATAPEMRSDKSLLEEQRFLGLQVKVEGGKSLSPEEQADYERLKLKYSIPGITPEAE